MTTEHRGNISTDLVESYIRSSVNWFAQYTQPNEHSVLVDIGCDYGYAMQYLQTIKNEFEQYIGIEPYPDKVIPSTKQILFLHSPIEECHFDSSKSLHLFLNHILEHLERPIEVLVNLIKKYTVKEIFIAVPDATGTNDEFIYFQSHLWTFTPKFFSHILTKQLDMKLVQQEIVTLRDDCREIWNLYRK